MTRVRTVKILESQLARGDLSGDSYQVRARWRVQGTVEHWAHVHARTNLYRALYTVGRVENGSPAEDGWKITGVQILSQERAE